ncbi:hypothetical protein KW797_02100 [Candidatus Parcubacteria bacterium]|nr:hypothetical protein [Candidatus Parcubacteria bacterium]
MAIERDREVYERDSSSGILVGVLVAVVIAVIAWLAYSQGLFRGGPGIPSTGDNDSLRVNVDTKLPGTDMDGSTGGTGSTGGAGTGGSGTRSTGGTTY